METLTDKETIERQFGAAMRYSVAVCGHGTQAAIIRKTGIDPSNLSSIIKHDKGTKEHVRSAIFFALLDVAKEKGINFGSFPYDLFLTLGQLILDGKPGDEALKTVQVLAVSGKPLTSKPVRGAGLESARPVDPASITAEGRVVIPAGQVLGEATVAHPSDPAEFLEVPKARAKLSAGSGYFVEEGIAGKYHFRSDWLRSICSPADAILFDCSGESMWPTISDKETVLVDRGDIEFQDGKVFAIGIGETALIKRLRLNIENMLEIISDNPDKNRFPTDTIAPDEVRILGRVRWHGGEL